MADIKTAPYKLEKVAIRLVREAPLYSATPIHTPEDAVKTIAQELSEYDRECFCVLSLRSDGSAIGVNIVSTGTLSASIVSPREVFKASILANAASIIAIHNHPSGSITPSGEDIEITKQLQACGELFDIPLIDHIIVGGYSRQLFSMREHGYMSSRKEV